MEGVEQPKIFDDERRDLERIKKGILPQAREVQDALIAKFDIDLRQLTDSLAASLAKSVDGKSLTLRSKLPFNVLSLRELLIHRVSSLASAAVVLLEQGSYVAAAVLNRAVMETAAIVFALHKQLEEFGESKDVGRLEEFVINCLMGSRSEDSEYQAKNVLTFVNHVAKKFPGFRTTYDSLSEYAHPNWCGVFGSFGDVDRENHVLVLGLHERTAVYTNGVMALSAAVVMANYFYEEIGPMVSA